MLHRLLLLVSLAAALGAAPITYRFSGTGSGSVNGNAFTDNTFTVTLNADTTNIANQPSIGALGILNLNGFINLSSIGTFQFSDPQFVFTFSTFVGFGNFTIGNSIMGSNPALSGYALTPIAPLNIGSNTNLGQFGNVATNLGPLGFTSMSEVTFEAVSPAPIPEPSSFLLMVPAALLLLRRR